MKKLALLLLLPLSLLARGKTSGYCEQGGYPVVTGTQTSTTLVQRSFPSCTVTVYYNGGGNGLVSTSGSTVTLISGSAFGGWAGITISIASVNYTVAYVTSPSVLVVTTNIGTNNAVPYQTQSPAPAPIYSDNAGTPLSNPFTASSAGDWGFYANNGAYDVQLSGTGLTTYTIYAIPIIDPTVMTLLNNNSYFNFAPVTPGGTLVTGSNTINLASGIPGVSGSNLYYYLEVSGGVGTAEPCLVTGGTATSGTPGTMIMTCANSHSGAWTISSATCGVSEAENVVGVVTGSIGTCLIHGSIYMQANSVFKGQGIYATTLNIASDFPVSGATAASGVFVGQQNITGNGPQMSDFNIVFTQPDSTNISLYTQYPPAFDMISCGRFGVSHVQLTAAWDGVVMTGNSGGARIIDLQASVFDKGVSADGALDSVQLTEMRFWPYNLTANQLSVMQNNTNVYSLYAARLDDLHVTDFFSEARHGIYLFESSGGCTYGSFTNVDLDTSSNFTVSCGEILVTNLRTTLPVGGYSALIVYQGADTGNSVAKVRIVNSYFYPGACTGSNPVISLNSGNLWLTNSDIYTDYCDNPSITENYVNTGGIPGTNLFLSDTLFERAPSVIWTNPTVNVLGGRITATANRTLDLGAGGSGVFFYIPNDDWHVVEGNSFVGWASSYPAIAGQTGSFGIYQTESGLLLTGAAYPTSCGGKHGILYNNSNVVNICP